MKILVGQQFFVCQSEDSDELGGAGTLRHGMSGQLLQQCGVGVPGQGCCVADVPFHPTGCAGKVDGNCGIQIFGDQNQMGRICGRQLYGVNDVVVPCLVGGDAKGIQNITDQLIHVFFHSLFLFPALRRMLPDV